MKLSTNQNEKKTAGRETDVSRHHQGPLQNFLKPLNQSHHHRIEGFKDGPPLELHYAERRQCLGH